MFPPTLYNFTTLLDVSYSQFIALMKQAGYKIDENGSRIEMSNMHLDCFMDNNNGVGVNHWTYDVRTSEVHCYISDGAGDGSLAELISALRVHYVGKGRYGADIYQYLNGGYEYTYIIVGDANITTVIAVKRGRTR